MKVFNTAVRCTVLTFVFLAAIMSIAGLSRAPQQAEADTYAVDEEPVENVENNVTTSQEMLQAELGNTG